MNNTEKDLISAQSVLRNKMEELAKLKGLSSDTLFPIFDGVADVKAYLQSSPKIMWILKEPYDYINEETKKPEGGGWTLMEDIEKESENPLVQSLPRTIQRIIYTTSGIYTGIEYDKMDYYYQPNMYKYLFQIAYINLSKMPAGTRSGDMTEKYLIWKDIIFEQIKLYNPEVIIFGNTFQYMKEDLGIKENDYISSCPGWVDIYKNDIRLFIDAYHPGIFCSTKQYVNTLVNTIRETYNQNKQ